MSFSYRDTKIGLIRKEKKPLYTKTIYSTTVKYSDTGTEVGKMAAACYHRYNRHRLLTHSADVSKIKNSRWRLNRAKGQATVMEKAILGTYFWKLMFRIYRNRLYIPE